MKTTLDSINSEMKTVQERISETDDRTREIK